MNQENFLGTGWSFPPRFNKTAKSVVMVSHEDDIRESIHILLSTRLRERIMHADFGCDLNPLLFENITTTLLTKMKGIIKDSITRYEPRVQLDQVNFSEEATEGKIFIEIIYTIRTTNSRYNYVYPFYIKEGTYLNQP